MNLIKLSLVALVTIIASFSAYSQKHAIKCQMIQEGQFINVAENLYVDLSFSKQAIEQIKQSLRAGKIRVERTYGITTSEPTIIVTNNVEIAESFGSNATASTISSPLGECIVVGPKGQNTDVFAHELVNAELSHRLGYYTHLTDMPAWFKEGLALSVDNREPYRRSNINLNNDDIRKVTELFYTDDFLAMDDSIKYYQASKIAVARVLAKTGPKSLYRRLERLRSGDSFSAMFGFAH
ncbi:MAG: hypothetical protein MJK04_06140 [Psychrosphaera sp.]|nr:hypothetical protein [Psychrosphaera sp.]